MGIEQRKRFINLIKFMLIIICIEGLYYFSVLLRYGEYECIVHRIFSIYCPGCGSTRMIKSLLKLEIYKAFRYNQFMFIGLPTLIIYSTYASYKYVAIGKIDNKYIKFMKIFVVLMMTFGILRNIPFMRFLLPTEI